MLSQANEGLIVMHPLPRSKDNIEIAMDVDRTPNARYIEQAANGYFMRQAILLRTMGEGFEGRPAKQNGSEELWVDMPVKDGTKRGKHFDYKIDNGTLIDHIEAKKGISIALNLGINDFEETGILALKVNSQRYGQKDVIGLKDLELDVHQQSRL